MTLATQQQQQDTFTQVKHSIAIGLILLIQAVIVCLIRGKIYRSFWFSYILFIIIIGGILVVFIYITRLASNETFSPSNKILITTSIILPILLYVIPTVTNNKEINAHNTIIENGITTTMTVSARVLIVAH
jgi:NADH-ubiquinone oxidoreductase chain 6